MWARARWSEGLFSIFILVLVLRICICDEFIQLYTCLNTTITNKDFKILIDLANKQTNKPLKRKEIFVCSSLGKAGTELREESLVWVLELSWEFYHLANACDTYGMRPHWWAGDGLLWTEGDQDWVIPRHVRGKTGIWLEGDMLQRAVPWGICVTDPFMFPAKFCREEVY